MTLLAVYFQLASSNCIYIVELYNFQLDAVNKAIHTLDKFFYIATFYKLECLSQYLVHSSTYESHFKLDHVYFQQNIWIFVYTTVFIDQDQGAPPPIEAFVRVGGSLVHCALSASVCLRLLTCVVFISSDL